MTVSHSDAWILGGIQVVARKHLGWRGEIQPDLRIVEALALDSLRLLTLVVEIENHFRICLDEETEARIETVRDLVEAIRRKLDGHAAHAE